MFTKQQILEGRKTVSAFRITHRQIHKKPWYKGIDDEYALVLSNLVGGLTPLGFSSLEKFLTANEELNVQELGFVDRKDFKGKATEADIEALERKWH